MRACVIVPLVLALSAMVWGFLDERDGFGASDQVLMTILFGAVAIIQASLT